MCGFKIPKVSKWKEILILCQQYGKVKLSHGNLRLQHPAKIVSLSFLLAESQQWNSKKD